MPIRQENILQRVWEVFSCDRDERQADPRPIQDREKIRQIFAHLYYHNTLFCPLVSKPSPSSEKGPAIHLSRAGGNGGPATKLPLTLRFAAVYLIVTAKNGISSVELGRRLGVKQPAAWTVKHKIKVLMVRREGETPLSGRVEMDDAWLGGVRSGGKRGRGAAGKTTFVAAGLSRGAPALGVPFSKSVGSRRKTRPENMAGQSVARHRRADQEAAQADDPVQMRPALSVAPRYPAVARRDPQGRGGKPRRTEITMCRDDQVAHLTAREGGHPARMLIANQGVRQPAVVPCLDDPHRQGLDRRQICRDRHRLRHRIGETAGRRGRPLRRRQSDQPRALKAPQRLQAPGQLRMPPGIQEIECLTDTPVDRIAARSVSPSQDLRETGVSSRLVQGTMDLVLPQHGRTDSRKIFQCSDVLNAKGQAW